MIDFLLACAHLDPLAIIKTGSYLGVGAIIFAESGLLVGIFFPGDSLLFAAGLLAGTSYLNIAPLIMIVVLAALLGDNVGYWFGKNVGSNLFLRKDSRFFKQEYLRRTERFYATYGGRAVVLARFVPIVRTLAPMLAGVGSMKYTTFLAYNAIGATAWGAGITALGYLFGSIVPNSQDYVLPATLAIIVASFFPILLNVLKGKRAV